MLIAGRLADDGYEALPGSAWARTLSDVPPARLHLPPGNPIYVTSDAFGLTTAQVATLHVTTEEIWTTLRNSGLLTRVAQIGRVTLYRMP